MVYSQLKEHSTEFAPCLVNLFFYLSNELLSIIENAGRLNIPMPDVIKRAVKILKGESDDK
ncbi:phage holin family protein [Peribacillus sp. Hz7]|uniref:phage holin family protein n=1 Tax=Peribacillus sp. Hz7 TaxID=3344873 RepID=UPI0035CAABEB